jgi:hypothetical protein
MDPDEAWLLNRGFVLEVEQTEPNLFWAHLTSTDSPAVHMAPKYGRGKTPDEAITRARERYEVEELGVEPSA